MMKKLILISFLLIVTILFSGCSVTAINDAVKNTVKESNNNASQTVVGTYIESESNSENSISKTESKTDNVKGIGESFDSDVKYETDSGTETRGTTGLKYTFNSVEIFDNFYDSGEDIHACSNWHDWDYENNCWGGLKDSGKKAISQNNFILVEMTASYNAPEGGKEDIDVRVDPDIYATFKKEKMPEGWFDEFILLREQGITVMEPVMYWFSEPILEEDGYDIIHDGFCFKLKDGESRTFKIGIYCWDKFIEYKNVYLSIQHFNPGTIEGYDGRYFAIFPEE